MKMKEIMLALALSAAIAVVPLAGCAAQGGDSSPSGSASATTAAAAGDAEYVLYLGTNDKDTNEPVYSPEESKQRAKAILMKDFGGYTIQEAEGGWKGDDGTEYQEYTLVIYLSDTDIDTVHAAAKELIDEFHQSSVLINTQLVETEFYDGE
ncbi:MAG: DUF3574 domain-containing protein [Coriobacteriia bacterium]|nr:DUF3574 domain-containing protein [Coriobacteriia bacterium]